MPPPLTAAADGQARKRIPQSDDDGEAISLLATRGPRVRARGNAVLGGMDAGREKQSHVSGGSVREERRVRGSRLLKGRLRLSMHRRNQRKIVVNIRKCAIRAVGGRGHRSRWRDDVP